MTFGNATKTIGGIFMNDVADDEIGVRGTAGGGNLLYNTNGLFRWFGSGVMDKPIGDFWSDGLGLSPGFPFRSVYNPENAPYFAGSGGTTVRIHFYNRVIPEPEEYALVFGLFALGFVFFCHFRKKPSTKN